MRPAVPGLGVDLVLHGVDILHVALQVELTVVHLVTHFTSHLYLHLRLQLNKKKIYYIM